MNPLSVWKFGPVLFSIVGLFATGAQANLNVGENVRVGSASVRVSSIKECEPALNAGYLYELVDVVASVDAFDMYLAASNRMSCTYKKGIENFMRVNELVLEMITVGAMCTPTGAPVAVAAGIGSLGLHMINLVVSNLECDDPANDQRVAEIAKITVCEALNKQGLECNPNEL